MDVVRLTDVRDKENAFGSWCAGWQLSGLRCRAHRAGAAGGAGRTDSQESLACPLGSCRAAPPSVRQPHATHGRLSPG